MNYHASKITCSLISIICIIAICSCKNNIHDNTCIEVKNDKIYSEYILHWTEYDNDNPETAKYYFNDVVIGFGRNGFNNALLNIENMPENATLVVRCEIELRGGGRLSTNHAPYEEYEDGTKLLRCAAMARKVTIVIHGSVGAAGRWQQ